MKNLRKPRRFKTANHRAKVVLSRQILAVFMESPFYFTIPLQRRLEFLKFFSQAAVYQRILEKNQPLFGLENEAPPR